MFEVLETWLFKKHRDDEDMHIFGHIDVFGWDVWWRVQLWRVANNSLAYIGHLCRWSDVRSDIEAYKIVFCGHRCSHGFLALTRHS